MYPSLLLRERYVGFEKRSRNFYSSYYIAAPLLRGCFRSLFHIKLENSTCAGEPVLHAYMYIILCSFSTTKLPFNVAILRSGKMIKAIIKNAVLKVF